MDRLRGSAETTVDEKGRFKVPSVFRAPIEETFGPEFFLTSISGVDVLIFPMPVWNALEEKLAAMPAIHRAKAKFRSDRGDVRTRVLPDVHFRCRRSDLSDARLERARGEARRNARDPPREGEIPGAFQHVRAGGAHGRAGPAPRAIAPARGLGARGRRARSRPDRPPETRRSHVASQGPALDHDHG